MKWAEFGQNYKKLMIDKDIEIEELILSEKEIIQNYDNLLRMQKITWKRSKGNKSHWNHWKEHRPNMWWTWTGSYSNVEKDLQNVKNDEKKYRQEMYLLGTENSSQLDGNTSGLRNMSK